MKRLIIALAVAVVGFCANAAAFQWKTGTSQQVYLMNTTDRAASMTAYLFDFATYSQSDVVSAFLGGSFDGLSTLASVTTSTDGAIATTADGNQFTWGNAEETLTAYFAVIANVGGTDYLYVSPTASGEGLVSGTTTLTYSAKTSSQAVAMDAYKGYKGAGWYAAAVPEPTSGLLLLLGMAGLALKRKQA